MFNFTNKKKKVYCKECRFFSYRDYSEERLELCETFENKGEYTEIIDNYKERLLRNKRYYRSFPDRLNRRNNCKYFQPIEMK